MYWASQVTFFLNALGDPTYPCDAGLHIQQEDEGPEDQKHVEMNE